MLFSAAARFRNEIMRCVPAHVGSIVVQYSFFRFLNDVNMLSEYNKQREKKFENNHQQTQFTSSREKGNPWTVVICFSASGLLRGEEFRDEKAASCPQSLASRRWSIGAAYRVRLSNQSEGEQWLKEIDARVGLRAPVTDEPQERTFVHSFWWTEFLFGLALLLPPPFCFISAA